MHLHDERISLCRVEADRVKNQPFDPSAVAADPFDFLLTRQDEIALEHVVRIRHPRGRGLAPERQRVDIAESRRLIELKDHPPGRGDEIPAGRNEMLAVGQLRVSSRFPVDLKHLAVHAHVDRGKN